MTPPYECHYITGKGKCQQQKSRDDARLFYASYREAMYFLISGTE